MSEMIIREIIKDDIPGMVKIFNQHYKALTNKKIKHNIDTLTKWWGDAPRLNLKYFGLFVKNQLKAFMILEYRPEELWLSMIAVNRKDKKKGYGNELLKVAVKESGDKEMFTEIKAENITALNIVFKKGFELLVFNEELNEYILQKTK